jgi:hypothetical protein
MSPVPVGLAADAAAVAKEARAHRLTALKASVAVRASESPRDAITSVRQYLLSEAPH